MPVFEYFCDRCGKTYELIKTFSNSDESVKCKCGNYLIRKPFYSCSVVYKGSGFYTTDSKVSKKE